MSNQKEITKMLLESKVVDFDALGRAVSQLGPQTIFSDDPWENFCGTMRYFIRIFRLPPIGPRIPDLERLDRLEGLEKQL
ncbi:MAG: hypothetical protein JST63_19025 [Bacteroidetes bacterium]|nr:hypothetical protein [Bacteroidota bacterium]